MTDSEDEMTRPKEKLGVTGSPPTLAIDISHDQGDRRPPLCSSVDERGASDGYSTTKKVGSCLGRANGARLSDHGCSSAMDLSKDHCGQCYEKVVVPDSSVANATGNGWSLGQLWPMPWVWTDRHPVWPSVFLYLVPSV